MVAQRLGQNPWEGRQDFTGNAPPPLLYLKSLQNQIQQLREQLDPVLEGEAIILWTHHNAEVLSQKMGLSQSPAVSKFPDRDFNRLQYLCACLAAVKSLLDILSATPASRYHTLTVPMVLQTIWNIGTLQLLSTFEHPDGNVAVVNEAMNFLAFLKNLADTMSMVKSAAGYDSHTSEGLDFWSLSVKGMTLVQGYFEGTVPYPENDPGGPSRQDHRDIETTNFSTFPQGVELMDFMDDVWMEPSDYQRW